LIHSFCFMSRIFIDVFVVIDKIRYCSFERFNLRRHFVVFLARAKILSLRRILPLV
jgi:hypothetical protein